MAGEPPAGLVGGLSTQQALALRQTHGPNALAIQQTRPLWRSALEVAREPMFLLLMACLVLYFLIGDWQEGLALMVSVVAVMGITLVQERRTERALDALKDLASPRALVIRDGQRQRIDAQALVPGDLMVLLEGDRVPADGVLVQANNLQTDESLLTGESVPVDKQATTLPGPWSMAPLGDDSACCVFSGALVVQGQGFAQVLATGAHSEIGRIGGALSLIETGRTPLQEATRRMVRGVAAGVLVLGVAVLLIMGLTRGDWVQAALAAIAWSMALLPEEFPVVLTIFLALGAWRMSRRHVLTRRMPALETLGAATVLCVDKTGTLTENRMRVVRLALTDALDQEWTLDDTGQWPPRFAELVDLAVLASRREPFDPMEVAIHAVKPAGSLREDWTLTREYPLAPELLAVSRVWQAPGADHQLIATKGAPEAIASLCHLPPDQVQALLAQVQRMAGQGLRVLGVARARTPLGPLAESVHDFDFEFVGLIALADPVRAEVPHAMAQCRQAGIRIIMITGDYPATASSIAHQAGIGTVDGTLGCLTGAEVAQMDDVQLREAMQATHVIARATPELKLRIVRALQARGEVVAMTGDGVNDAPALRAADIGIAMGGRGTDVAREASDLILTDDRFSSIVEAIGLGRRIYANLTKASGYIVAVHIPIAGLAMFPVLTGGPLMLLPIHVAFLELMIDPACSIAFEAEPEEARAMREPPRRGPTSLFGASGIWPWVFQGLLLLSAVLSVHAWAQHQSDDVAQVRALSFSTLVLGNMALILGRRAGGQANHAMWAVVGGTGLVLALILSWPWLRGLFGLAWPGAQAAAACALVGVVLWPALMAVRALDSRQPARPAGP
ncbi:cation-translocating P-type ATPase [Aquabacterium sp. CECT 9606]|uniref:cation-translocating P-type ATPase n=1 Tax=Aquabacterium sp. CECT 9606 TaxID=2845822 RepID=UPI001E548C0A|nr:cation-translocating P-type ATPase [Aquabacterium sp. CECT 9606]CAH0351222.1 Calcium-transporting ATPase 1 [Aquabacterium sp. CECT 9606]